MQRSSYTKSNSWVIVSAIRHEHFGMKLVHVFKEMEDSWSIVTRLCSGDPVPVARIFVRIDGET